MNNVQAGHVPVAAWQNQFTGEHEMGVFQRLGDIFSANLNDIVEQFEDPEKMLQQAIREMEDEIAEATAAAAKALANEKILTRRLSEQQQEARSWQQRAEQAVEAGDDKLARKALARKQECQALESARADELVAAQDASQSLRHHVEEMKSQHADAKLKLGTLVARKRAADARRERANVQSSWSCSKNSAFEKFDRLKDRVAMAEAEAEAMVELGRSSVAVAYEPESTPVNDAVEVELLALKQKLRK